MGWVKTCTVQYIVVCYLSGAKVPTVNSINRHEYAQFIPELTQLKLLLRYSIGQSIYYCTGKSPG